MKYIAIILLLLLLTACEDIRDEFFPNGRIRISTTYVDNKKQGIEKEFFENGNIKAERIYFAGKLIDTTREYYENGQIKMIAPYRSGAIEGTATRYHDNGQIASITRYNKGKIEGFPREFDSQGKPTTKGNYEDPRDHKVYSWVRIANQVWTAENMNFATEKGSLCAQCNIWGRLYDFESAKKACPAIFHLPSMAEWNVLFEKAGKAPAAKLKATFGWDPIGNTGTYGNGSDDFGFSVRASGAHFASASVPMAQRVFKEAGQKSYFWTAEGQVLVFENEKSTLRFAKFDPRYGASLRCVLN